MTVVKFKRSFPIDGEASITWKLLMDIESYPSWMSSVQSVAISVSQGRQVSHWRVSARGHLLDWTAQDHFDHSGMFYRFSLIEGDFDILEGIWSVVDAEKGCQLEFEMAFDIGIPVLANTLNPILEEVLSDNISEIAANIAARRCNPVGPRT
jgi:ribosome-associated toxin RatA of RatAB toxin-antitoxin module